MLFLSFFASFRVMQSTQFKVPNPLNEPILGYLKGSKERSDLKAALSAIEAEVVEIPCIIGEKPFEPERSLKCGCPMITKK